MSINQTMPDAGVPASCTAGHYGHFVYRVRVGKTCGYQGVASFVVGDEFLLLFTDLPASPSRSGKYPVDGLFQVLEAHAALVLSRGQNSCFVRGPFPVADSFSNRDCHQQPFASESVQEFAAGYKLSKVLTH